MRIAHVPAGLALALGLTACAGAADDPAERAPSVTPTESTSPGGQASPSIGEVPADLLQAIVADAAQRAGVEPDALEVLIAEEVTWSDGSIGCPEPGMMYTQALVPGYRVVVEADGEQLNFHASRTGDFRFCEDPPPPVDGGADR